MSCAFHKTGVPRVGLLELREMTRELLVDLKGRWIPPTIRAESIVEDVEATQVFDVEIGEQSHSRSSQAEKQVKG